MVKSRRYEGARSILAKVMQYDPVILVIPAVWLLLGFIEVFSASKFRAVQLKGFPTYFMMLDLFWRLAGILVFITVVSVRSTVSIRLMRISYIILIGFLVALLFSDPVNGSRRWFSLGPVNLHPSEFVKVALVALVAYRLVWGMRYKCTTYTDHFYKHIKSWVVYLVPAMLLVALQPDLSTAGLMGIVAVYMYLYYYANDSFSFRDVLYATLVAVIGLVVGVLVEPYRLQRVKVFLNLLLYGKVTDIFGSGNQIYHILIGIARGGLWGVGLGQSRQQAGYLVEATAFTDSISAVIFEELGAVIGILLILSFLFWFRRILLVASSLKDDYGRLVLVGVGFLIFMQAFIHFAVNLALIPITGMTLPFISYGGSSLIANMLALGIATRIVGESYT